MSHEAMMQMMQQGRPNANAQGNNNMQGGMRRMGSMRQRWSMLNPQLARQLAGENQNPTAIKQYVRVGDTLSNGYTLAEVTRTGATLIRGNDRLELELQDPSKNRANRNYQNRRANPTQQFQQAQMFMQGQMMRTMQQMQRTIQSNSGGGNRNRGGARR